MNRAFFQPKSRLFLVDEGWFEYKNGKLFQVEGAGRAENLVRAGVIPETNFKNYEALLAALERKPTP